jgi:Zn-dependent M28 family amino/carboxypeptidase
MYSGEIGEVRRGFKSGVLIALITVMVALPVGIFLWMTSVPGSSFEGPIPPPKTQQVEVAARLKRDVIAIASKPHNVFHHAAYIEARDYILESLKSAGYAVRTQEVMPGADNIIVDVAAKRPDAPLLVIGAHYDSAENAPGANDNGTGTAALLELARSLKAIDGRGNNRLRLIWFANEEPPYFQRGGMGSVVAARQIAESNKRVIGMISLETLGYYDERAGSQHYPFPLGLRYPSTANFVAFVGMTSSRPFLRQSIGAFRKSATIPSVGGVAPAFVEGIDWSDHWAFQREGIPAFMVTDTAPFRYPWYHTRGDTADKVDFCRLTLVVDGLQNMIMDMQSKDL